MILLSVGYYYIFERTHICSLFLSSDKKIYPKFQEIKKLNFEDAISQIAIYRDKLSEKQIVVYENQLIQNRIGRQISILNEKNIEDYNSMLGSLKQSNKIAPVDLTNSGQKISLLLALSGLDTNRIFDHQPEQLFSATVIPKLSFFGGRRGFINPLRGKKRNFGRYI
jgi:hypothetical protein